MKGWALSYTGTDAGTFDEREEALERFAREFLKVDNRDLLDSLAGSKPRKNWRKKK